ncbi:DUF4274 domain-containing protein [Shewanella sp. ISTPL2]|uniref:DUF4274 domain-containing protein n=1 Tax=Shewanella sp. ISTPL2 TaxID=2699425 RepID=UPI0015691324|nr:DUF4274 domain-containing protein [Shewanella sp. ISTPL2]
MTEIIDRIVYEIEDVEEAVNLVKTISSAHELYALLDHYNWDDGNEIPIAIADHPLCELAIAIKLFWLAEAMDWLEMNELNELIPTNDVIEPYQQEHYDFAVMLTKRILSGYYQVKTVSHTEKITKTAQYFLKKRGVPEILYQPIVV